MARKAQPIARPAGFSPPTTRARARRTVQDTSSQDADQQTSLPTTATTTRKRAPTTKPKPEPKTKTASKTTSKVASKNSGKVTKPRGKAASKNKKVAIEDEPTEPVEHDSDREDDAADHAHVKPASKASKTPAKTRATKKPVKTYSPEQLMNRRTRGSTRGGYDSPLSQTAQDIMGLMPEHQAEQESTPLSVMKEEKQGAEWFPPALATPYKSAQKSANDSELEPFSSAFSLTHTPLFQQPFTPVNATPSTFGWVSERDLVPSSPMLAENGVAVKHFSAPVFPFGFESSPVPASAGPAPAPLSPFVKQSASAPASFEEAVHVVPSVEEESGPVPASNQEAGSAPAPVAAPVVEVCSATPPRVDSPMEDQYHPSSPPSPPQPFSPSFVVSPAAPARSPSPEASEMEVVPTAIMEHEEIVDVVQMLEGARQRGYAEEQLVDLARRAGANVLANIVIALLDDRANRIATEESLVAELAAAETAAAKTAAHAAAILDLQPAADDDAATTEDDEHESHDEDVHMSDDSDRTEADDGQDEELEEADPATPGQEPAQTTPTSSYYLSGLFTKGLTTGKSFLSYINPFAARPQSPPSPTPTPVRSLNRKGPVSPRIKDADKRARMLADHKNKIEKKRRHQEESEAQHNAEVEKAKQELAAEQPGQKRKRKVLQIPAHRPGERGYGMVDEIFELSDGELEKLYSVEVDDDQQPSPELTPATKRAKFFHQMENEEDPRFKEPINLTGMKFAADKTSEQNGEVTLQRPRNALRRVMRKETGEDPADKHHETKIKFHENSFGRPPLRDSQSVVNRRPSNDVQSSSALFYNGSTFAQPGDSGYKSNVFKSSEMELNTMTREQMLRKQQFDKIRSMTRDELQELARVTNNLPEDEKSEADHKFVARIQRRYGHVPESNSFSMPEGSDDEDEDESTEYDTTPPTSFEASFDDDELVATSGIKQASDLTPTTAAPTATTPAAVKQPKSILKKPAEEMVPPPTPKPANAQLPTTEDTQSAPKPVSAFPTTDSTQAAPQPASVETVTEQPTSTTTRPVVHEAYLDRPRPFADAQDSIARARKNAEKHRPTKPSNLSHVERVASSPIQPFGETVSNPLSQSLITQGMGLPAVQNQATATLTPFGTNNGNSQGSALPFEMPKTISTESASNNSLTGNSAQTANAFMNAFQKEIDADTNGQSQGLKRKRSMEEVLDNYYCKKPKTDAETIKDQN